MSGGQRRVASERRQAHWLTDECPFPPSVVCFLADYIPFAQEFPDAGSNVRLEFEYILLAEGRRDDLALARMVGA